jgi:hypothetical protein
VFLCPELFPHSPSLRRSGPSRSYPSCRSDLRPPPGPNEQAVSVTTLLISHFCPLSSSCVLFGSLALLLCCSLAHLLCSALLCCALLCSFSLLKLSFSSVCLFIHIHSEFELQIKLFMHVPPELTIVITLTRVLCYEICNNKKADKI